MDYHLIMEQYQLWTMDFHYGLSIFHLVIPISVWNNMDYHTCILPLYDPNNPLFHKLLFHCSHPWGTAFFSEAART